jgi:hypothetical protein
MSASFIPVALLPELGAGLQGVGAFSEETIAAAALLDHEALTCKAVELRFSTLPPESFSADSLPVQQHLTPENCHRRGRSGLAVH